MTQTFPASAIDAVLVETVKASVRERDLPARVVVCYVLALALFIRSSYVEVLRCLLEEIQWLRDPSGKTHIVGKSGISPAQTRLGSEPLRRLHDELVKPVAVAAKSATLGITARDW